MFPTMLMLLAVNLIPLYLVLYDQWTVSQMVLLFWLENVMIGVINVIKMRTCQPHKRPRKQADKNNIQFFILHYGLFTFVHGIFVIVFFFLIEFEFGRFGNLGQTLGNSNFWWTVIALLASHGFSYYWHFLRGGECHKETTDSLFAKPYGRVIVLHLTILAGAGLAAFLMQPVWALVLLVCVKTLVDVLAHYFSHKLVAKPA